MEFAENLINFHKCEIAKWVKSLPCGAFASISISSELIDEFPLTQFLYACTYMKIY